ncbi:hypothetical protein ABZU86_32470 [Streptomyces sp. NPDC005271]|uniref:hypothetical protein n=1 Tax=unclassified Streptomyces TaxID=2593676 RepID=UPI00339DCB69
MVGRGQRGRGRAPLLALCAALLGLFLMHGAPASAVDGCHGAMPMTATATAYEGHHATAEASAAQAALTNRPGAGRAQPMDGAGTHGALCVSTPARDRIPLPTTGLVSLVALAGLAAMSWAAGPWSLARTGLRAPPTGGRALLLRIGVART